MSIPLPDPTAPLTGLWIHPDDLGDMSGSEFAYEAARTASFLLWGLSGRKFSGESRVTELYNLEGRSAPDALTQLANDPIGLSSMTTVDVARTQLRLRHKPVTRIVAVTPEGAGEMSEDHYYLFDHSTIQFLGSVPRHVQVTYWYGSSVPIAGRMAARQLAMEFARLWSGDAECALPDRVTSVSRQGMSFTILDNQDFIAELRTGVYAVDLFLKTVNPDSARRKSKVFSPDIPRGRRRTTPHGTSLPDPALGGWIPDPDNPGYLIEG